MLTKLKDTRKAGLFTSISLLLGIAFASIPGISGFLYMMTPTLAALIMMLVVTRDGYSHKDWRKLGLHKLGLRGWLPALIIPIVPLALGYGTVWALGMVELDVPTDFQGFEWEVVPAVLIFALIKGTLFESLGEELGWRGYLLPRLMGIGERKAMLINGVIHGIWHFPIILLTREYHQGEKLWILLPFTVVSTMFLAPVISMLRLRTGSVWPASLMHTSHNLCWLVLTTLFTAQSEGSMYLAGDMGLIGILFYAGLTWYLWRGEKWESRISHSS
ncbi:type II CAAX endopeptidase family protein [Paenibacillus methanolicus]|uniref:CAAX prenyl protease-like protein n=1 Tax=Paenibacillus methanolicus TaxID=582686 RepID=A0A5S5CHT5_9BACL|nr:type II CAAX endopeptidase family protein [Paenibacillus methanolicus]TYP79359.1 CAAX prenyl protease-like protein [Paenibacillus methanolicus]